MTVFCRNRIPLIALLLCIMPAAALHSQPVWKEFGRLSGPRLMHSALQISPDEILVIGGLRSAPPAIALSSCEIINVSQRTVTPAATMGVPRASFAAVLTSASDVVVVGGTRNGDRDVLTSVELFDVATRQWRSLGWLRQARRDATAVLIDDNTLLVVGGRDANDLPLQTVELFDIVSGSTRGAADYPQPVTNHVMDISLAGVPLSSGGLTGTAAPNDNRLADVYRYVVARDVWERTGTLPREVSAPHLLKLWDGRLLVSGGASREMSPNFLTQVGLETTNDFRRLASMINPRVRHGAGQWDNQTVITFGGFNDQPLEMQSSSEWIDLTNGVVRQGPSLDVARAFFASVTVRRFDGEGRFAGAKIFAIGGQVNGSEEPTTSIEILEEECELLAPRIEGRQLICPGDSSELRVEGDYSAIEWSTGSAEESITIAAPGRYSVTVTDELGCRASQSIDIGIHVVRAPTLSIDENWCPGESVRLTASPGYTSYQWSTGETGESIEINEAGSYTVVAIDSNGCTSAITSSVRPLEVRRPLISGPRRLCSDEAINLQASEGYVSYRWSDGREERSISVSQPGLYTVTAVDVNGCTLVSEAFLVESALNDGVTVTPDLPFRLPATAVTSLRCVGLELYNGGSSTATLSRPYFRHNVEFSIPAAQLPLRIAPGTTTTLTVCFASREQGTMQDELVFEEGCLRRALAVEAQALPRELSGIADCDVALSLHSVGAAAILQVLPNPADREATVDVHVAADAYLPEARLFDGFGNVVAVAAPRRSALSDATDSHVTRVSYVLRTDQLPSGVYFLRVAAAAGAVIVVRH